MAAQAGASRTYRVSRIRDVRMTDRSVDRPADFDLAAYWKRSAAEFKAGLPRFYAKIRISPAVEPWMSYMGRASRVENSGPPGADGWRTLDMRFDSEEEACQFALSFGCDAEVLDPESLRSKVVAGAQGVLDRYSVGTSERPSE